MYAPSLSAKGASGTRDTVVGQLDQRVLDRWTVHLRDESGAKGPLNAATIHSYRGAVNANIGAAWPLAHLSGTPENS